MTETIKNVDQNLSLSDELTLRSCVNPYGTVAGGDFYFENKLNSLSWLSASAEEKFQAIFEATQAIDKLSFIGVKTNSDQKRQFPRKNIKTRDVALVEDTTVPDDIVFACYELALRLLDGVDIDMESENLASNRRRYDSVETYYDRRFPPVHVASGIPSIKAWHFLLPYLRDNSEIVLSRVL